MATIAVASRPPRSLTRRPKRPSCREKTMSIAKAANHGRRIARLRARPSLRTLFAGTLTSLLLLGLPFGAKAQQPIVIKFSHVTTSDTPKGKGAEKFKELAEKYTGGKVKVEVYPNSQLYKDKEEIEALQLGAVQMLAPSTAKFAPLGAKEFEALDLPFLFANDDEYTRITKGPVGQWLFQKLVSKGISGLAFWDNGFQRISANRPLTAPPDFQGPQL